MKILNDGEPYEEFEHFLTEHMQDGKLMFEGIFCVTDGLAHTVIKMLHSLGLRVPEDVQVIGFDGIQYFNSQDYICSTIVQPVPEIAGMCVDLLLQENMPVKPPLICLPVSYGAGGTTLESRIEKKGNQL